MRGPLAFIAAILVALPLSAGEPKDDIEAVIFDQIDAFLADDLPRAFSHASPNIQTMFGNPSRFGRMVESGYPMVWRPARFEMLTLAEREGDLVQTVLFEDFKGQLFEADYQMVEVDGRWRINGVSLRRVPGVVS